MAFVPVCGGKLLLSWLRAAISCAEAVVFAVTSVSFPVGALLPFSRLPSCTSAFRGTEMKMMARIGRYQARRNAAAPNFAQQSDL